MFFLSKRETNHQLFYMKKALLIFVALFSMWTAASAQTESDSKIKVINQQEFLTLFDVDADSLLQTAVIDFNATWCGPCRRLAPILEELAAEYEGRVNFYSIDVDQNRELAKGLEIQSIPYLLFIAPGLDEPQVAIGLLPKEELKAKIEAILPTQ